MKGLLKRLQSKSGSVLFLVVVVMSLLIIAASATYYVVSNQRSSVQVHYSSEQSYQWATSVGSTVSKYIDGYAKKLRGSAINSISGQETNILTKMIDMNVGDSFEADLDLIKDNSIPDDVKVTITKTDVSDDGADHIFAITTSSVVNGETVTITEYKRLTTSDYVHVAEPFTRFLTSTGYRSENCALRASEILSEAFFENEFTLITNPTTIRSSIYARGSLSDTGLQSPSNGTDIPGLEIVVSQNFAVETGAGTGINVDKIYVGRNLTTYKQINVNEVYVLGDFTIKQSLNGSGKQIYYVNGDCVSQAYTEGTFYVNGDLYLTVNQGQGKFFVDGDLIVSRDQAFITKGIEYTGTAKYDDGSEIEEAKLNNISAKKTTNTENFLFDETKVKEAEDHIYEKTGKQNYQQWNAEKYFDSTLNKNNNLPTIQPGSDGNKTCTITGNCILKQSATWGNEVATEHILLIDTTSATSDIFIKLEPLEGDTFSFMKTPANTWPTLDILVKGPRAVVFILPSNVNFEKDIGFIGHADLVYAMANAAEKEGIDSQAGATNADKVVNYLMTKYSTYIHNNMFGQDRRDAFTALLKTETDENGNSTCTLNTSDTSKFPTGSYAHNNIFLVTSGKTNSIDYIFEGTFCGYTYAPYTLLTCKGDKNNIALVGGLIAGSYTYWNWTSSLAFLSPYDYYGNYSSEDEYDPSKLVQYLMTNSGGTGGNDGDDSAVKILSNCETIGYK